MNQLWVGSSSEAGLVRWSVLMADSVIRRARPFRWHYEHGLILTAVEQVWIRTGDPKYFSYLQGSIGPFVDRRGNIGTYSALEYNLDQINPGRALFLLYRTTGDERYEQAIRRLREQLRGQPRIRAGGFWHKRIYPHQMWLDGIYMASPFYAEFGQSFGEPEAFDDVAHQITLIAERTRDAKTGLLYHAWDESKSQRWANPVTGCSPHFWGRAMGWYAMALVDVLDLFPAGHSQRSTLLALLGQVVSTLSGVQDPSTGLWYQILDQGSRSGNYLEASASCMFVYAIAKGVRKGYLASHWLEVAQRGYRGILGNLIEIDAQGLVTLNGICSVAGLGGEPYRDGSYQYYVGERVVANDYKGVGPFILASLEMEPT